MPNAYGLTNGRCVRGEVLWGEVLCVQPHFNFSTERAHDSHYHPDEAFTFDSHVWLHDEANSHLWREREKKGLISQEVDTEKGL